MRLRLNPRGWLLEHWPIKIVALLLSILLWMVVAAKRPVSRLRPVELQLELRGRALTQPPPNVSALVVGRASAFLDLYRQPLRIHKVVPDTVAPEYVISLSPSDVVIPPDAKVSVQEVQPPQIRLALDEVVRRRVPVLPRVSIRPDSGYVVAGGISVIPSEVEVWGSRAVVAATDSVPTAPAEILHAREPVRRTIPLDTGALGMLRVTPREVHVTADVVPVAERLFAGIPVTVEDPRWATEPTAVTLMVRGPAARVLALVPDSFSVSVTPPLGAVSGDSVPVVPLTPSGLTALSTPATVVLRRRGRGG